jgi:hypothetical protein
VIDFETLNPPLLDLLGRLAVGNDFTVEHAGRSRKIVSVLHKRSVVIEQLSISGGDQDEERRERIADDATGPDAKWAGAARSTVVGDRVVTYQIGCDALENTDAGWAWSTIERLRTRLRRQSTIAELEALDASINHVGDAKPVKFKLDGRLVSRVIFELVLNVHAEDVEDEPTGLLKHVEWTDEVKDVDGVQLPSPPLVTDEITPPLE